MPTFVTFLFSYFDRRRDLPVTRTQPAVGPGCLKEKGKVAYILSVLILVKNNCRTNCCFETLCTLATVGRQCASCKVMFCVYGVLQNAATIQALI